MNDASSRESIFTVFHDNSLLFKVNKRYIAPLLLAYDDRIKEKQAMLQTYEVNNHLYMIYTRTLTWQYPIVYMNLWLELNKWTPINYMTITTIHCN